jgi:replicative DNA helicase
MHLGGWTRLDKLKIGDAIAVPLHFSPQKLKNPLKNEELILLAHLLGDGCILPTQPYHYTNADMENIKTVRRSAKNLFNIEGKIIKQKNLWYLYLKSPYHLSRNKYHPITNWFKKLKIERVHSWEKKIPEAVFQCDHKRISLFLKHLWATDGNLSWKYLPGRKPAGNIYYCSSSETLIHQVQHLLLRLNISSSIREITSKKYRPMFTVYVEGAVNQLKFLTKVGIADKRRQIIPEMIKSLKEINPNPNVGFIPKSVWKTIIEPAKVAAGISWREFSQKIDTAYCGHTLFESGISRERMTRVAKVLKMPVLYNLATADVFWDEIVSIKKLRTEEVYDATVKGVHNFVANDIIVHNSLEQDADVVLFIYRKSMDRGIKNCPPEEKNIAEIHISKHRHGPAGVVVPLYFDGDTASYRNLERKREEGETDQDRMELPF